METSRPKDDAEGFEELLAIFKAAGERIDPASRGHLDELRPDAVARFLVKSLFDRLNESLKRPLH